MLRRALALALGSLLLLALGGCPRAVPLADATSAGPTDAGAAAPSPLEARVDALDAEVGAVLAATDQALWAHFTAGASLDLAPASAGHDALFTPATLQALRQAQKDGSPAVARRAALLEQWVAGELLSRSLRSDQEAVASLEAGATFTLEGREVAWRELPRLLAAEKSAVKRRALWAASLPVAARLGALLAHREERARAELAALGAPEPLAFRGRTREVDLPALGDVARAVLEATDARWRATLAELSAAELKLPVEALTRADLPRLLRAPPAVDAAFPRAAVGPRGLETLAALGLDGGAPTLEASEDAKRQPLPLTVAPSPRQVRVSFKPVGGLRDQVVLLSELGSALALASAATGKPSLDRLGDPARPGVAAALLAGLAAEPGWLQARGVPEAARAAAARQARALELYALRRAAAVVLLHLETEGQSEEDAGARAVALLRRALGVQVAAAEAVRWRLDLDDGLRSASQLRAALAAASLEARLGAGWWESAAAGQALRQSFAAGASQPLEASFGTAEAGLQALRAELGLPAVSPVPASDAGTP